MHRFCFGQWPRAGRKAEQSKQSKAKLTEHRCVEKRPSSLPSSRSSRQSFHHNPLFGRLLSFCCASTQNVAPFRLREFLCQDNSFRDLTSKDAYADALRIPRIVLDAQPDRAAGQRLSLSRSLPVFSSMYLVPRKPGHPGPPLPPPFTSCTPVDTLASFSSKNPFQRLPRLHGD
ncbi:hypothetical protein CKAH01_05574 [Colletotrichum kahawae]|uniref:Uncharacterized protein n=1 Tax=Colletotrichum kahawae TaxID=34407 RepID=A0AAD9YG42_COLKA|nr:hypothetical protein CKAH01_05574 [Colletotrichum kahawae]